MDFSQSKTKDNLMKAFAGESQAQNRYTFAASLAQKKSLKVIEEIFLFTANQERAHAKVFYKILKEFSGGKIFISGNYPVDLYDTVLEFLKASINNEYEEYEDIYACFSKIAKEEGFDKISSIFENVAKIEKVHGDRFLKFKNLLEQEKLFVSDIKTKWMCLNCGEIYEGFSVPEFCPVCDHPKDFFIKLEFAPFTGNLR